MESSNRPLEYEGVRRGRRGMRWLMVAMCLAACMWSGCTAQRRYRVLSFFFDGVPDPNAPPGLASTGEESDTANGSVAVKRAVVYVHKPYADNECDSCHVGATGQFEDFKKLESSICMKCHSKVPTRYPVMHGPVAAVECLWCHVPHESTIKGMLKEPAPAVCMQCHDRELLSANPPEHMIADKSCLDCHLPHGGPKHKLLREDMALQSPAPATMPTTRSAS